MKTWQQIAIGALLALVIGNLAVLDVHTRKASAPLAPPPTPHVVMGASVPSDNPWLNQTDFYYDPANSSAAASDNNPCITSGAPCLTFNAIMRRLGGPSPLLSPHDGVPLNIHLMSNAFGNDRPMVFLPYAPTNSLISIVGTPTVVGTCTISSVTARNTASTVGTETALTASCPTTPGQFVINTTNASAGFVKSWSAGSGVITQMLTRCDTTTNTCPRTEVNNWSNGDSLTVETFPTLNADVAGALNSTIGTGAFGFSHVQLAGTNLLVGQFISLWECSQAASSHVTMYSQLGEALNYYMPASGSFDFHVPEGASLNSFFGGLVPAVEGGIFQIGADIETSTFGLGVDLEHGVTASGLFDDVYLGAGDSGGNQVNIAPSNTNRVRAPPNAIIWGPGSFQIQAGASMSYGIGQSTSVFHNGTVAAGGRGFIAFPGVAGNSSGTAPGNWCAINVGGSNPVSVNCGIAATAANMETAWGSGGCGGNCFFPGGFGLVAMNPN